MGRGVWYIVAVGLVIIVVVGVAGEYSLRSATCMACHSQEASFAQWMAGRLKAEKKGFAHELIACADCHIQGSAAGTPVSRLRGLLHIVSYVVPQIEPRRAQRAELFNRARIPSESCQVLSFGGDIPQGSLSQRPSSRTQEDRPGHGSSQTRAGTRRHVCQMSRALQGAGNRPGGQGCHVHRGESPGLRLLPHFSVSFVQR